MRAKDPSASWVMHRYSYNLITGIIYRKDGRPLGTIVQHGYTWTKTERRYTALHRIAWLLVTGSWPQNDVDHVNGNRSCNTWINLRAATRQQNAENRKVHKNNRAGVRGIRYRPKDGRWEPRLMVDGKPVYLGIFKTLEEAIEVRKSAEKRYFTHAN